MAAVDCLPDAKTLLAKVDAGQRHEGTLEKASGDHEDYVKDDGRTRMTKHWTLAIFVLGAGVVGALAVPITQGVIARTVCGTACMPRHRRRAAKSRTTRSAPTAIARICAVRGLRQGWSKTSSPADGRTAISGTCWIVKATMPQNKPASLTEEYAAIVAYLLQANRYPAGQQELHPDPAALKAVVFKR